VTRRAALEGAYAMPERSKGLGLVPQAEVAAEDQTSKGGRQDKTRLAEGRNDDDDDESTRRKKESSQSVKSAQEMLSIIFVIYFTHTVMILKLIKNIKNKMNSVA
jgi:hypothetical protein